jgi:hypothetical protein
MPRRGTSRLLRPNGCMVFMDISLGVIWVHNQGKKGTRKKDAENAEEE